MLNPDSALTAHRLFCVFVCLQVSTLPVERRTLKSTVPEGADTHAECLLVRQVSSDLETEQVMEMTPEHSALTDDVWPYIYNRAYII